jgi:hypothetical protein
MKKKAEAGTVRKADWVKLETVFVGVNVIEIGERILPPTPERIEAMKKSLAEHRKLLTPALVRKAPTGFQMIAGATRLLAARELGWKEIEATIIEADDEATYELLEIVENVDRHDLTADERTKLRAREKQLRAQRLARLEELLKAQSKDSPAKQPASKGGRGKKGGIRAAARAAGVPRTTARRAAKLGQIQSGPVSPSKEGGKGRSRPPILTPQPQPSTPDDPAASTRGAQGRQCGEGEGREDG